MAEQGTITRRLARAYNTLEQQISSLITADDFAEKLEEVQAASPSGRPSQIGELCRMLEDVGIPCKKGESIGYYETLIRQNQAALPDWSQVENRMVGMLYSLFTKAAAPEEYMLRMVNRLSKEADGWQEEPLRLRILKQFVRYANSLADAGIEGQKACLKYLKEKTGKKYKVQDLAAPEVLEQLDDGIFAYCEQCVREFQQGREQDALAEIQQVQQGLADYRARACDKVRISQALQQEEVRRALGRFRAAYLCKGVPAEAAPAQLAELFAAEALRPEYMQDQGSTLLSAGELELFRRRCVLRGVFPKEELQDEAAVSPMAETDVEQMAERLSALLKEKLLSAENLQAGTDRLLQLDECRNFSRRCMDAEFAAGMKTLTASIRSRKAAVKDAVKSKRKSYELQKLAEDLASGRFRQGGVTKQALYLFAMAYGMMYCPGDNGPADPETDIEKNLFQDYYNNNLLRFISESYIQDLCEFELDPTGQGINYKNFAEVVYLYYLSRQDLDSVQKVRGSAEMIDRIIKKQRGVTFDEAGSITEDRTLYFKNKLCRRDDPWHADAEKVFAMPENEFEEYLCAFYDCNTVRVSEKTGKTYLVGAMQLEAEQNTAYNSYLELREGLRNFCKADMGDELQPDEKEEARDYGLWFTGDDLKEAYRAALTELVPQPDDKLIDDFFRLLEAGNRFLCGSRNTERTAGEMSRTALLTAYYYYYNEKRLVHPLPGRNFKIFYEDFSGEINDLLEQASYQPLSSKYLFDVLLVFSSYMYLRT